MHIEVFIHSEPTGARASVKAWWVSGTGTQTSYLLQSVPLPVDLGERDPWVLLRELYLALSRELAERSPARS